MIVNPNILQPALNKMKGESALEELMLFFQILRHPGDMQSPSLISVMEEFSGDNQRCDFFFSETRSYKNNQDAIQIAYAKQELNGHLFRSHSGRCNIFCGHINPSAGITEQFD